MFAQYGKIEQPADDQPVVGDEVINDIQPEEPRLGSKITPSMKPAAETKVSMIDTNEENPATVRHRKNTAPNLFPPGMRLIAFGKATKARPILSVTTSEISLLSLFAITPSTANTPKPVNKE